MTESGPHAEEAGKAVHGAVITASSLLTLVTVLGAVLRCRGLTDGGLWRDDAWVALSARVGLGTAWHMWVTAPGFYFVERSWIIVHPGSTEWNQIPPLIIGTVAIPAIYWLARYFRIGRGASLLAALFVSVSPICVIYSSRLKEYGADFLVACLMLAAAESARRNPGTRQFLLLAVASIGTFTISASVLPVLVGVWLALALSVHRDRTALVRFLAMGILTAVGCGVVAGVFYRHLSPALRVFWQNNYIGHGSPATFVSSTLRLLLSLSSYMAGGNGSHQVVQIVVSLALAGLFVIGLLRSRTMVAPAFVLGSAIVACVFEVIPLGTGRTDEALYPAILLPVACGLEALGGTLVRHVGLTRRARWTISCACAVAVIVFIASGGFGLRAYFDAVENSRYPTEDTQALAHKLYPELRPGDHIVVSELMRYPWALYEDQRIDLVFNSRWSTGFSVTSTQPRVFIAPSEFYEGGSEPEVWTKEMAPYRRLWFVETPPLSDSPLYGSLIDAGWHATTVISATGCRAILLIRAT